MTLQRMAARRADHAKLRMRGHHLLCVFGFRGLGYSEQFVQNMQGVVERFFSGGGAQVQLVTECDDICAACPRMRGGRCVARRGGERRIRARDRAVLEAVGLAAGTRSHSSHVAALILQRIDEARLARLCTGCSWLPAGYCQEGLRRRRGGV